MNKLEFKVLGITTYSDKHIFQDCGFVDKIAEYTKEVYRAFMKTDQGLEDYLKNTKEDAGGSCTWFSNGKITYWVIFYKHYSGVTELLRRAHEETHVLHGTGNLKLLDDKLHEKGINIKLSEFPEFHNATYEEKELVANIGGIYALHKQGIDVFKMPLEEIDKVYHPAMRAYIKNSVN